MRIIFYGGKQAGMITLLTLLAMRQKIICVIPVDEVVEGVAKGFKLNVKKVKNINNKKFVQYLKNLKPDLLVCCHGRQILKKDLLSISGINLHPCLFKYKGANPIERFLKDKTKRASVGVHWMSEEVDRGKVIVEEFLEVEGDSPIGVYNQLYPLYSLALIKAIRKIKKLKN